MEATPKIPYFCLELEYDETMFFMGSEFSAKPKWIKWLFSHGTDAAMAVAAEAPLPMAGSNEA